jgi:hypothetical protein
MVVNCEFCWMRVSEEDARGPLSTGKVNKGVVGPQCIANGWFPDSNGW